MIDVFIAFLRLGLTSFGGPIAHLSYFHDEFVSRKKWLNEHAYADLVALCQFLPGPASSQVGIAIGLSRAGLPGAIAAWLGFTLPSAIILVLFGLGISRFSTVMSSSWIHGLKIVAVSVVAQALWGMGVKLCPDKTRATIAILTAMIVSIFPSALIQVLVIFLGGILGWRYLRKSQDLPHSPLRVNVSRLTGSISLVIFAMILLVAPLLSKTIDLQSLRLFDSFFRAGSLVFGGGHVVLPLLQAEVVSKGWVSNEAFMAGYGLAQAIPGPLFTFSAYLGAISKISPMSWMGASICLFAAFLPSFLLIIGVIPFWESFRRYSSIRFSMQGVNAAVMGLLLSAFYHPVWTSGILTSKDFSIAIFGFLLLVFWKTPSWLVVLVSASISGLLT